MGEEFLKNKDVSTVMCSKEKMDRISRQSLRVAIVTRETLGKAPPTDAI